MTLLQPLFDNSNIWNLFVFHIDVLSFCGLSIMVPHFIIILAFLVQTSIFCKFLQRSVLRLKDGFLQRNPQRGFMSVSARCQLAWLTQDHFFFKFFIEFVTTLLLFYVLFFFGHEACGTLAPNQGSNLHFLQWKVKSQRLDPQGSPSPRSL